MDRTFELYDKGMKIIASINAFSQGEMTKQWVIRARPLMREYWGDLLKDEINAKRMMFHAP